MDAADIAYRNVMTFSTTPPTARDLFDKNDKKWNWTKNSPDDAKVIKEALNKGKDLLEFNAQTTLAASYGLLQVMPDPAMRKVRWKDPFGKGEADIHPRYLTDKAEYVVTGDGSLHVATVQLLYSWFLASNGMPAFGIASFSSDTFASFTVFQDHWRTSTRLYNWGASFDSKLTSSKIRYGDFVIERSGNYFPYRPDTGIAK